jgi:hypothetical protein
LPSLKEQVRCGLPKPGQGLRATGTLLLLLLRTYASPGVPPHVKLLLELKEQREELRAQREELRAQREENKAFFLEMPTRMFEVVQRWMGAVPTASVAGVQFPSGAGVSLPEMQVLSQLEPIVASLRALQAGLPAAVPVRYFRVFWDLSLTLRSLGPRRDRLLRSSGVGACAACPESFRCQASLCRLRFDCGALARMAILHFVSWSL